MHVIGIFKFVISRKYFFWTINMFALSDRASGDVSAPLLRIMSL
jgi:hypothetical protein